MGPTEVLLPFIVKNRLAGGAGELGLVFAAGGLGSLVCALAIGQLGLPRRSLTFMYLAWTAATLAVAGYGLDGGLAGLMVASVLFNTLETAGTIAWATASSVTSRPRCSDVSRVSTGSSRSVCCRCPMP